MDERTIRPQHNGLPADEWPRECGLLGLPHQQQLQPADCADGLRDIGMPLNDVAANDDAGALDVWPQLRCGKLRKLSYDGGMGFRFV